MRGTSYDSGARNIKYVMVCSRYAITCMINIVSQFMTNLNQKSDFGGFRRYKSCWKCGH